MRPWDHKKAKNLVSLSIGIVLVNSMGSLCAGNLGLDSLCRHYLLKGEI